MADVILLLLPNFILCVDFFYVIIYDGCSEVDYNLICFLWVGVCSDLGHFNVDV